jgi:endogenous inhibitor of DNA gyrase (YacG/DUF329 family)
MNKRIGPTGNNCKYCGMGFEQAAKGRLRWTCSDACKQALYRSRKGVDSRDYKRKKKITDARRALPMEERSFKKAFIMPLLTVSYRRYLYECLACGQPYIVNREKSGSKVRPYCSKACKERAEYQWNKFHDAYERVHQRGELSTMVRERMAYGKLSPLCPRCGKPFAPNKTLYGQAKRGRPRKYCSDACRKEAYERRWKTRKGTARVHRNHPCAECGTLFDRRDGKGRRRGRFCSLRCRDNFAHRAYRARKRTGRSVFRWGVSGMRAAALGAPKNKAKRALRNTSGVIKSGGGWEILWSDSAQVQSVGLEA